MSAVAVISALALAQFCPSYTLSSSANDHDCGVNAVPGTNPSVATWQGIFDVVSKGPTSWGSNGPAVANIGEGCGRPTANHPVSPRFPCELLKSITYQESGWRQFCAPSTPSDQVGKPSQTIISFDCGYGIGQVTSGMHVGEAPAFDRARVASDPTYNLATGTQILAEKWRATDCVGDNQPAIIEHWYYATWAYNGLAYVNNPHNPNFSTTRGVYNPANGGAAPYQEKVFGWMQFPPSGRWVSTPVAYPRLSDISTSTSSSGLSNLPDPTCASPTSCASTRGLHVSSCFTTDAGVAIDAGVPDAGRPSDAGSPDAGRLDGGMIPDAGPRDAGQPTGPTDAGPIVFAAVSIDGTVWLRPAVGCGCTTVDGRALIAVAMGALLRRRRR